LSSIGVVRARAALAAFFLALAPVPGRAEVAKHEAPIPQATLALMSARNSGAAAPILIRTFKKEAELEIWKLARGGRYVLLKTFPICRWSGQLGPKLKTGDRQTLEGFYTVARRQMNPNSAYHLSFDIGFPNAFDRAQGASGSYLMVHGNCSSMGCYAMTDKAVGEIYATAREAFAGGQRAFQFQAFPFRMSAQNLARHRSDRHIGFWRQLKEGFDRFEATGEELSVGVAGGRYTFAPSRDAGAEALAQARLTEEAARVTALVDEGVAAVRTTYADGGQHASFTALVRQGSALLGMVSRPEALAVAGHEIVVTPAGPRKPACTGAGCPVQVATLKPADSQVALPAQVATVTLADPQLAPPVRVAVAKLVDPQVAQPVQADGATVAAQFARLFSPAPLVTPAALALASLAAVFPGSAAIPPARFVKASFEAAARP